ncbi:MAG: hypothetical protein AAGJ46_07975 [Planctomycetota bacterium]
MPQAGHSEEGQAYKLREYSNDAYGTRDRIVDAARVGKILITHVHLIRGVTGDNLAALEKGCGSCDTKARVVDAISGAMLDAGNLLPLAARMLDDLDCKNTLALQHDQPVKALGTNSRTFIEGVLTAVASGLLWSHAIAVRLMGLAYQPPRDAGVGDDTYSFWARGGLLLTFDATFIAEHWRRLAEALGDRFNQTYADVEWAELGIESEIAAIEHTVRQAEQEGRLCKYRGKYAGVLAFRDRFLSVKPDATHRQVLTAYQQAHPAAAKIELPGFKTAVSKLRRAGLA